MSDRIIVLQEWLSQEGAIFISIDDNEQHNLRSLMDEIFGGKNFVECFVWKKKGGAGNTETLVGDIVEYVLMYARDWTRLSTNRRIIETSTYPHRDEGGVYKLEGLLKTDKGMYRRDTMKFPVPIPDTDEVAYPPEGKRWTVGEITMMDLLQANLLHFSVSEYGWTVKKKKYFDETDPDTGVYLNLLMEHGSLKVAKDQMEDLGFAREAFGTPKPLVLVKQLLDIICKPDDIIFDFFAGSGTTAHATINLNRQDNGKRKYILMEMGHHFDTVLKPRIKKAIYAEKWKDAKPVSRDSQLPHIIKYQRIESYEDALNNIEFSKTEPENLLFDEHQLSYMLESDTKESPTFLNISELRNPFSYQLKIVKDMQTQKQNIDLPETFNYLLGLSVQTRQCLQDDDRRYLVYKGTIEQKTVVIIWRETEGWQQPEDWERDHNFIQENILTESETEVYVNTNSIIPGAKPTDPLFKRLMFE